MITVTARPAYHRIVAPPDDDLTVNLGDAPRTGGLDVVGRDRSRNAVIQNGDISGARLNIGGVFHRVDVRKVRADIRDQPARDIINVSGDIHTFVGSRCRLVGVHGQQSGVHGDVFGVLRGASVRFVVWKLSTFASAYQIMMFLLTAQKVGVQRVLLDRINILDEPDLRVQQSIAVLMACDETQAMKLEIRDSWINWPKAETHALWTPRNVAITGAFQIGRPPGGDFCPA